MRCRSAVSTLLVLLCALGSLPLRAETLPRPLLRDFLGVCGHTVQFKPALYAPVCSLVRDYHPVEWDLGKETGKLPDFPFAKNRVNWQTVYGAWAKENFRTNVCLMFDSVPADRWKNFESDIAAYATAFAEQFGPSGKTPLVEAVEIGNEPGNYSDEQYTAMLRAAAPSLRRADPKLRIATCNLTTGPSTKYAKSVTTLQRAPDALEALDVLTIHTYAEAEPWPTWRRSYPEDPKLKYLTDVTDLAKWRNRRAPGKAIWITEFGYDATTRTPDPKTEFARWVGVTDTQQAQYLVRSTLLFTALPVERAYIYFFDDKDQPQVHGSSGITRHSKPKPAYHALAHLQSTLGNYRFGRVVAQKPGECYAYEYAHANNASDRVIVAWSPTGSDRRATVALPLPPGARIARAQRMPLTEGVAADLPVPAPTEIPIDESPLYLFLTTTP